MSVVTDVVAITSYRPNLVRVASALDEFYQRRYKGVEFGSEEAILDYDHDYYDNIQVGPKVGGASILWFTLNHQSADNFVDLLRERGIKGVTLWIDAETSDDTEVVTL